MKYRLFIFAIIILDVTFAGLRPDHGLVFNGEDNYVVIEDHESLDLTGDFTIEFWIKVDSNPSYAHILNKHQPGINDDGSWVLKYSSHRAASRSYLGFSWPYMPKSLTAVLPELYSLTEWSHVALCYDEKATTASVWLNGRLLLREPRKVDIKETAWPLFIGAEVTYNYFSGSLSEIRFSSIVRYRDSFTPPLSHVPDSFTLAYWPCNEAKGDILHDLGQYENHGKVIKGAWVNSSRPRRVAIRWNLGLILAIAVTIAGLVFFRMNHLQKRTTIVESRNRLTITSSIGRSSAEIRLFGGFRVVNKRGKDITGEFTPLGQQIFVFLLMHSYGEGKRRGVSTDQLTVTFWPDSDPERAKNSRGTALTRVRKILGGLDSVEIAFRDKFYFLEVGTEAFCDYIEYWELRDELRSELEKSNTGSLPRLLDILGRGTILPETNYRWLDPLRAWIIGDVVELCLRIVNSIGIDNQPELLLRGCDTILSWDSLNEEALSLKVTTLASLGRHGMAKSSYEAFTSEYLNVYQEPFPRSLKEILSSEKEE